MNSLYTLQSEKDQNNEGLESIKLSSSNFTPEQTPKYLKENKQTNK